jgi:hypothetical protein
MDHQLVVVICFCVIQEIFLCVDVPKPCLLVRKNIFLRSLLARFSYFLVIFSMFARAFSWRFFINLAHLLTSNFTRSCTDHNKRTMGAVGLKPYTISNGQNLVVECTALLYANSTCGRFSSQIFKFFLRIARSSIDNARFTTSAYPSVCGRHIVENSSCVPSFSHKVFQK